MEADIVHATKVAAGDVNGLGGGIDNMQVPYARRDQHGPAPAAATDIGADALQRQPVPWKVRKITVEYRLSVFGGKIGCRLRECLPFTAKSLDCRLIDIFRGRYHR